jgi:hypothetical protein
VHGDALSGVGLGADQLRNHLVRVILDDADVAAGELARTVGASHDEGVYRALAGALLGATSPAASHRAVVVLTEFLAGDIAPSRPKVLRAEIRDDGGARLELDLGQPTQRRPDRWYPLVNAAFNPDKATREAAMAALVRYDAGKLALADVAAKLLAHGDFASTIWMADAAERLDPKFSSPAWWRAQAREGLGDIPGAIADYERVAALTPQFADARQAVERLRGSG